MMPTNQQNLLLAMVQVQYLLEVLLLVTFETNDYYSIQFKI